MREFIRFFFEPIDDDEGCGNDVFAVVELPDDLRQRNDEINKITDSISSYVGSVPAWNFEGLVHDVLNASGFEYELVQPSVICI